MMENEHHQHDKQELRQYCNVSNRELGFGCQMRPHAITTNHDHDHDLDAGNQGTRMKPPQDHHANNKHFYFLRAKTPRFHDDEFKKPCSKALEDYASLSEEEDLANCLVMLSNKSNEDMSHQYTRKEVVEMGTFQCKACKKVFSSHQALGGHRASHKKVKGCFASKNNDEDINNDPGSIIQEGNPPPPLPEPDAALLLPKRTKMHECSVCRRVFSSGQALGGHKRCHWLTTSSDNSFIPNFQYDHRTQQLCKTPPLRL